MHFHPNVQVTMPLTATYTPKYSFIMPYDVLWALKVQCLKVQSSGSTTEAFAINLHLQESNHISLWYVSQQLLD